MLAVGSEMNAILLLIKTHHLQNINHQRIWFLGWRRQVRVGCHSQKRYLVFDIAQIDEEGHILQYEVERLLQGELGTIIKELVEVFEEEVIESG